MSQQQQVKVWDPMVRIFHWSLAGAFFIAYLTEDELMSLHVWAGYYIIVILAIRILWGLVGTRYARFSNFVFKPSTVMKYIKDTIKLRAPRYLGHNPAGGAMIVLMFFCLLLTAFTGMAVYAAEEHAGPLVPWFGAVSESAEKFWEEFHEVIANFTMFLVFIHLAGVIVESLVHRENLVSAMVSGFKRKAE